MARFMDIPTEIRLMILSYAITDKIEPVPERELKSKPRHRSRIGLNAGARTARELYSQPSQQLRDEVIDVVAKHLEQLAREFEIVKAVKFNLEQQRRRDLQGKFDSKMARLYLLFAPHQSPGPILATPFSEDARITESTPTIGTVLGNTIAPNQQTALNQQAVQQSTLPPLFDYIAYDAEYERQKKVLKARQVEYALKDERDDFQEVFLGRKDGNAALVASLRMPAQGGKKRATSLGLDDCEAAEMKKRRMA